MTQLKDSGESISTPIVGRIIPALWAAQKGKWFCASTKGADGWEDHYFARHDLNAFARFANKRAHTSDVYFCPHGFSEPRRKKQFAVAPCMLWADLDGADPRAFDPKPTIAFESSPKRYVGLWLTDKPVTEDLNKRLTYRIGADKGGWDFTQVLRVPGTFNHKYEDRPRVRILWDDGPTYRVSDLEARLPAVGEASAHHDKSTYKKYESVMPAWLRRELNTDRPQPGKRSDMLWKMYNGLLEIGCSRSEIFEIVKPCAWNKFGTDQQLQEDIERALNKRATTKVTQPMKRLDSVWASDVALQPIEWLWGHRFAIGEIGVIAGMPDLGKSNITMDMAARVSTGGQWPGGGRAPKGRVITLSAEDSTERTLVPRLRAAGADLAQIRILGMTRRDDKREMFSLQDDLVLLEEEVRAIGNVKLVIIDPITSYLGVKKMDSYRTTDVRGVLAPFTEFASRMQLSVICVTHFNKNTSAQSALTRITDSTAFSAAPRHAYVVVPECDSDRILFLRAKNNLAPRGEPGLAYRLRAKEVAKGITAPYVAWDGSVDISADQALAALQDGGGRPPKEREEAEQFLRDALHEGPVEAAKVRRMADAKGITPATLRRAAADIGVIKTGAAGRDGTSTWSID